MTSRSERVPPLDATVVVAIPARDEAERLEACLSALDKQERRPDAVFLLLNNCIDTSERVARHMAEYVGYRLIIETRTLPPAVASAGEARRLAVTAAAKHAGIHGIVLTTDADAIVPREWVERNVAGLATADLVCGRVTLDAAESALIPAHLHADDARECALLRLLDEIAWTVDPEAADPWPRHTEEAGASLGMTVSALARVGGVPACRSGEDRALALAMRLIDARIRHDPAIVVTVSGRLEGRAAGGMADTIRRRMSQQDVYTDEQVEPACDAWRRAVLRRRLRAAWLHGSEVGALAGDLRIGPDFLVRALDARFFGQAWNWIQEASPLLRRQQVRFVDLPAEIAAARQILASCAPSDRAAAD